MKLQRLKKQKTLPLHYHVKRGDTVMIISGKDKGKVGTVKQIVRSKGKVVVDGVAKVKKSVPANPQLGEPGGFQEKEMPIPVSIVMLYDVKNSQPSRAKVVYSAEAGKGRISKKSGESFDE